jgi:hypothetical protein
VPPPNKPVNGRAASETGGRVSAPRGPDEPVVTQGVMKDEHVHACSSSFMNLHEKQEEM